MRLEEPFPGRPLEPGLMQMTSYPVVFTVARPERFNRMHLLIRMALFAAISAMGTSLGVAFCILYLLLPVLSAAMISQKGPARFHTEDGPWLERALRWVMAFYAYMALLTDKLPGAPPDGPVRFEVHIGGSPTPQSALKRLFSSLPSAIVLAVLSIALWLIWVVSAIMILITEQYPESLYDFQCGVLRWQARLLGFHASLVEEPPPFRFDPGSAPAA
jgi:hypothetical protein